MKLEPPVWLTDQQKRLWRNMADTAPRQFSNMDIILLTVFVVATDTHHEAMKRVLEFGAVVKSKNGELVVSPYLVVANRQAEIILRTARELGFTPVA